jgi:nucleotidyltransferase/DNA polymerase involved in DNA repair
MGIAAVYLSDLPYNSGSWQKALDALENLSPEVEDAKPGLAYLNVTGLKEHYGGDEHLLAAAISQVLANVTGLQSAIGVAANKAVAHAAAASVGVGALIVHDGEEAGFLSGQRVSGLPLTSHIVERLQVFGLENVSQVAALPKARLAEQFGRDGERLWALASGFYDEPLLPRKPTVVLEESIGFEDTIASVEVLVAAARQLIGRLVQRLEGRCTRELCLRAELSHGRGWERRIVLREAISERERLVFVTKTALREHPPPAAVSRLEIRLSGLTGERGRQLAVGERRWADSLAESIWQLKAYDGHSPIFRCLEIEPWSAIPENRYLLVEYDA